MALPEASPAGGLHKGVGWPCRQKAQGGTLGTLAGR